jgi:phytoene dehydrogenase-like protein
MMRLSTGRNAVVVGAGPNGLAAAVELARAGWQVTVYEAHEAVGGGTRTAALTLPGFAHDVCAAVHPMAVAAPYLRSLPLEQYGLTYVHPEACLAHPLDDGSVALLYRSVDATAGDVGP